MLVLRLPARFPLTALFAVCLGILNTLAFFNDNAWPLQIAVLAALFAMLLRNPSAARGARAGFAFGLGWFLVGISWLYISMHTYGMLPGWFAALAVFGFCAYLSIYPALALALSGALLARGVAPRFVFLLLPALWTFAEMLRGVVFTGFPWLATGYAQIGGPLSGFAPLAGVFGVTLACAASAMCLTVLGMRRSLAHLRRPAILLIIVLMAAGAILERISWSQPSGPTLHVRLLQGNISQAMKFDANELHDTLTTYLALVERAPADLIVLPETAFPIFFNDLEESVVNRMHQDATTLHATIALGVPVADGPASYTNSVVTFRPNAQSLARYDKSHLVPFGEFVPTGFHWFVRMMQIPLGDFTEGAPHQPALALAGQTIGFDICYEDLFAAQIARQAREASVLVNVSNVAWFGDSLALPEHLQIARMRALETGRPMLRATNTGMTAAIDAHGRVIDVVPPFTRGELDTDVQPMTGDTPYSGWTDWPMWLLCGFAVLVSMIFVVRAGRKRRLG